jgi:hypothetical protein
MRAALFVEPRRADVGDRPDASIAQPTGAVVRVLDHETDLDGIAAAYAAKHERRAIKSLVRVGTL